MSKKNPLITSKVTESKPYTLEAFKKDLQALRDEAENPEPNYTLYPDWVIDEYLAAGIVPKFVIVSPASEKKIREYLQAHPNPEMEK